VATQSSIRSFSSNIAKPCLVHETRGQTTAEYAVILTIITGAIVAAVIALGDIVGLHINDAANLIH
jgi:Flp pilus assembly pilin Flp